MNYREFLVKIGFETDERPLEGIEKRLSGIQHSLEFLAAAEVVKGIYEMTERFAHFAEELHVASVNAGIGVEEFQRLADAAGQSGVSSDQLGMSMARLSRQLYQAKMGSAEAQQAFLAAGFTQEQIQGFKNGGEAMMGLADRMHGMHDNVQKSALSMQLLGRSGYQMIEFLSKGSGAIKGIGGDFEKLGAILSEKQIAALVSVEHNLRKVWAVMQAFGAMVATYLAPIINSAVDIFLKFYSANRKILESNVKAWAEDLAYMFGFLHGITQGLIEKFLQFAATHQVLLRRIFELLLLLGTIAFTVTAVAKTFEFFAAIVKNFSFVMAIFRGVWAATVFVWQGAVAILNIIRVLYAFIIGQETIMATLGVVLASPWLAIAAAVAAIVFGINVIWTLLKGGSLKDTWLGQIVSGAGGLLSKGLGWLTGGLADSAMGNSKNLAGLSGGGAIAGGIPGASAGAGMSYNVDAPVNITVPPGTDAKETHKAVKDGIREHLDGLSRQMQKALTPEKAY